MVDVDTAARRTSRGAVVVGYGFIGTAVARALVASGYSATVVGRRAVVPPEGARSAVLGSDDSMLADLVRPDTDVVFAAGPSVPAAVEADASASTAALRLLARVIGVVRAADATLLFVSSGAVYGETERLPTDEGHPLRPVSAYGAAMVAAESLVATAARRHGIVATSLRCGNAYGPGQVPGRRQGLIAVLLDAVAANRPVDIWGDGSVERDYVHVDDVAAAVVACVGRRDLPTALNVGSGRATSVRAVLRLVEQVTGRAVDVRHRPARPLDVTRVALDTTRLQRLTAYDPVPIDVGLRRTWEEVGRNSLV